MKILNVIFFICAISFLLGSVAEAVDIPDASLRALIEEVLGKAADASITEEELLTLTTLHASPGSISDITGLEFATNLTELNLRLNNASDLSPLSGLTKSNSTCT